MLNLNLRKNKGETTTLLKTIANNDKCFLGIWHHFNNCFLNILLTMHLVTVIISKGSTKLHR